MKLNLLYVITVGLLFVFSCQHEAPDPLDELIKEEPSTTIDSCHPDTVYFERDVLPILSSNCAFSGCHDQGSAEDGVILTAYQTIKASDIIKDFDPNDSEIMEVINEDDPDKRMPPPPNDPLTSAQIALIRKWILQGAKDLTCISECDTSEVTFSRVVFPLIESRCKGCHSGTSPGGFIHLTNYQEIESIASDGRLLGVIKHLKGFKAMPMGAQRLPACQIKQIEKWVKNGAKND